MADDDKCHVFDPSKSRPLKKRRVERDATWEIREGVYRDLWNQQRNCIQMVLDEANHATIDDILDFLDGSFRTEEASSDRPISTGFILAGPDTTSHSAFFDQLAQGVDDLSSVSTFISLDSSECGNSLKGLLKSLVRGVVGDEDDLTVDNGTTKLLDYDLGVLTARMGDSGKTGLILALQDSEAFSTQVVMELIDLFRYSSSCHR
jgi:origin recognition complex subunit 3